MLKKARQPNTREPSNDSRTMVCTRKILRFVGKAQHWRNKFMLYSRIVLERHDHTATRAERRQNANHLVLRLSADGLQKTSLTGTRTCRCIKTMPENARCSPGANRTNSDTDTSTTSAALTTRSTIRRRRKLRLQCRSQDWMAVLQRAMGKTAGSIFIFSFAVANLEMANELELVATCIV